MSAPGTAIASARRQHRIIGKAASFTQYLSEEFAPRPKRLMRAMRLATLAAIGNGLMAATHVESTFGPYLLWAVAAAPRAMMTPNEASRLIVTQGLLLAISVPIAGILVEVPWIHVPMFSIFVAAHVYVIRRFNLSNAWLLIGVTVLDSFYSVIFSPSGFGWDAASTFGGGVIAFGVVMLFDSYLWPDPAEDALLQSVARDVERTRARLILAGRGYLDEARRASTPRAAAISELPTHLMLLNRVEREGASRRRKSQLLAIVTVNERLHLEVARLLAVAREPVGTDLRTMFKAEIERVIRALDAGFECVHEHIASGLNPPGYGPSQHVLDEMDAAIAALNARSLTLNLSQRPGVDPNEMTNLSAFFVGLQRLARLLGKRSEYPDLAVAATRKPPQRPFYDRDTARYCLKLAAAMTVMLVIALTSQRPEMTAALWTVLITGLPTYGATMRKMALRLIGGTVGGALAIAAIVTVTPNFDSVVTYMLVSFIVLIFCAWAAQSSSRIAYGGSQAGTTFVLIFAGLSPSERIYGPLWRVWAVILGTIVTAAVFILMWPEYAGESMLPRLKKLLSLNLRLMPASGPRLSDDEIDDFQTESTNALSELLGIADDARLEGERSGVNADAIVDAAGSLRRIVHRLGSISSGRAHLLPLSPATENARHRFEQRLARRLGSWLEYYDAGLPFDPQAAESIARQHSSDGLEATLDDFAQRIAAASYAEISGWPLDARRAALSEVESFRRLVVLAGELDQQFSAIPGAASSR